MVDEDEDEEIIREFLVEGYEGLDHLDQELVALEDDPHNPKRLASIFRTIHSLKGTSGFLGFEKLEAISHVGENLLSNMRDGLIQLDQPITDALLRLVDASREILNAVKATGREGEGNYDSLVSDMAALAQTKTLTESGSPSEVSDEHCSVETAPQQKSGVIQDTVNSTPGSDEVPSRIKRPPVASLYPVAHSPPSTMDTKGSVNNSLSFAINSEEIYEQFPHKLASNAESRANADTTIRVDVALLDRLMNLVGELVLSRNQVLQFSIRTEDSNFVATSQRLNHITTELQEGLMKTRMQPIKSVWAKFPRVVRDLSRTCQKDVKIELEGEDTELDRTIIEAIKDPMTHIVRNSVDHGIETPEERSRLGKPAQGTISLRAFHEGGKVNIEILDDGKGLDIEKIQEKALEKGVVTTSQLARMPEREVMQLVFAPGFSTAAVVTQVSGRGVGMDVVKTNIERIGGSVELSSRLNQGTSLKIKIPLTLAIIPALIVGCGGDSYAIPQVNLLELVRYEKNIAETAIEYIHGTAVCRLRGNLLPLIFLKAVLGVEAQHREDEAICIIVLQADERQFGLVVDNVNDTEEIVVKPLGKEIKSASVYAGATIMGDGRVALILDVLGVAQAGRLMSQERTRRLTDMGESERDSRTRSSMLVFRIDETERGAVPLKTVARLEEISRDRIEVSGGDEVVQYCGEIMPLIRIAQALGKPPRPATELEQVIVYQKNNRTIGIVVDGIEDVVDEHIEVQRTIDRVTVKGQAVLQGRVTELIDFPALISSYMPHFPETNAAE